MFNDVPGVPLDTKLPNLPPPSDVTIRTHAIDLVSKLLVYPPESRLAAQEALSHPFLNCDDEVLLLPLILPAGYPLHEDQRQARAEWEGLSLGELVDRVLTLGHDYPRSRGED
jgi:cell division cycle 2-like protein